MKKTLLITLLIFATAFAFTACGSSEPAEEGEMEVQTEASEAIDAGWEIPENEAADLPKEVQTAFDKATETFTGSDLKPLAYIAEQVVAGTNYMILCEGLPNTPDAFICYQMVVIYADLDGNAELTSISTFDITAYTEGENTEINTEQLAGGWTVPEDRVGTELIEGTKEVFDKATADFTGSKLEPLVTLGTQPVAGANFAYLCASTPTTKDAVTGIQVVTIYEDPDGNAKITNISTVDPADYNEQQQ